MKITHVGHASILVEVDGIRILSDPWWRGPCFGAQWWIYPQPHLATLKDNRVDYIYISHGHHDHFHPGTLKSFDRGTKLLVSSETGIAQAARDLGFEVIEFGPKDEVSLTDKVRVRIIPTHSDDTLMTVTDGKEVCANLNDALHSATTSVQDAFIARLRELFPRVDYLFCGYGVASHFPNCYDIPGKEQALTAGLRQKYFNRQWVRIVHGVAPRFGFPFAADVVFFENDLFWVNEPLHNTERPTDLYHATHPDSEVRVIDIAPGFSIEDGRVIEEILRAPVSEKVLRRDFADSIARANRYGSVSLEDVAELVDLLQKNVELCKAYLASFERDWRFLVELRNSRHAICIEKRGPTIITQATDLDADSRPDAYDLRYTVRAAYLKLSLTQPYGNEILFVGSGGVYHYASRTASQSNLHGELITILRMHTEPKPARYGMQPKWLYETKQLVKSVLGRKESDLYDLSRWSVFKV